MSLTEERFSEHQNISCCHNLIVTCVDYELSVFVPEILGARNCSYYGKERDSSQSRRDAVAVNGCDFNRQRSP